MILDAAAYLDGHRVDVDPQTRALPGGLLPSSRVADGTATRETIWTDRDRFAWVGLRMPNTDELRTWCDRLQIGDVDPNEVLAVHARPVLRVGGETAQLVLRTVRYDDESESSMIGEITVLAAPHALITIRHGRTSPLSELRAALECDPDRLRHGVAGVMTAIIGRVLDDYGPALDGFETDAVEVEAEVFTDIGRQPVQRLYKLKRGLRRMLIAIESLEDPLQRMIRALGPNASHDVLADMNEHIDTLRRTIKRGRSLSGLLDSALTASLTQISVRQNDDMRKISAWVAMAAVPTMVAGIYGMNFDTMPELRWEYGYPAVLGLMGLVVGVLHRSFKRSGWL